MADINSIDDPASIADTAAVLGEVANSIGNRALNIGVVFDAIFDATPFKPKANALAEVGRDQIDRLYDLLQDLRRRIERLDPIEQGA